MTINHDIWTPTLEGREGPKYKRIAEALSDDIRSGTLKVGDRLPTQRDLAWKLGVTIGTVTRAYQEAERRGIIGGEVGRGTFVRDQQANLNPFRIDGMSADWYTLNPPAAANGPLDDPSQPIQMQFNYPVCDSGEADLRRTLADLVTDPSLARLLYYQSPTGDGIPATAAIKWLGKRGLEASGDRLVLCSGAHNGILASLAAVCPSGGRVATERMVYPGLRAIARLMGIELVPVDLDEEGLVPDALREVLAKGGIDAIYCVATLQNPTNVTMSQKRREEIADIVQTFDVPLLEDDLFGLLPENAPKPICTMLPDHGYYITSLSKTLAPGLRVGYVHGPTRARSAIAAGVRGSTWMAAPITVEIASRWILDGTADRIAADGRRLSARRRAIAAEVFSGLNIDLPDGGLHAWLHLPEPWYASQFVNAAKEEGVVLSAAHGFSIGRDRAPFAVRICLGPPRTEQLLRDGLERLRRILEERDPLQEQAPM